MKIILKFENIRFCQISFWNLHNLKNLHTGQTHNLCPRHCKKTVGSALFTVLWCCISGLYSIPNSAIHSGFTKTLQGCLVFHLIWHKFRYFCFFYSRFPNKFVLWKLFPPFFHTLFVFLSDNCPRMASKLFSNFSCMFLNPNNFFKFEF